MELNIKDAISNIDAEINRQVASGAINIPDGIQLSFKGSFENQFRAENILRFHPLNIGFNISNLYIQFKSTAISLMIFSGVFVAWAGGFILLGFFSSNFFTSVSLFGFNSLQELLGIQPVALSIAVWVGFLALFGIATDGGVVMATYLQQRLKEFKMQNQPDLEYISNKPEQLVMHIQNLRAIAVEAASKRIRPTMITTATTIFALIPLFTYMGKGSEIMIPMAIPTLGGMFVQIITLFVVPILFIWKEERMISKGIKAYTRKHMAKSINIPPATLLIVCMLGIAGVGLTSESTVQAQNTLNMYKLEALNNHPSLLSKKNEIAVPKFEAISIGVMDPNISLGVFAAPIETALGAQTTRLSINQSLPLPSSLKFQRLTLEALAKAKEFGYLEELERHFLEMDIEWAAIYEKLCKLNF